MVHKKKIRICELCFRDSDLKREDVEIISESECVEQEDKEKK